MAQNQQQMMYYYAVTPVQAGHVVQNDGSNMNQGQMQGYDHQMQNFNMGNDHGGYTYVMNQDVSQMGVNVQQQMAQMQPTMMAPGNGCMQQMVLVPIMPDQQQPQQGMQMMDPNSGCQGCQACQQGCQGCQAGQAPAPAWGQANMAQCSCNGCGHGHMPDSQRGQQMQQMPHSRPHEDRPREAGPTQGPTAFDGSMQTASMQAPGPAGPAGPAAPTAPAAAGPAGPAAAAPAAGKKKLLNKKIDKTAPAPATAGTAAPAGGGGTATASSSQTSTALNPERPKASPASDTTPAPSAPRESGTGTTGTAAAAPVQRYQPTPMPAKASQLSVHQFASSIKALNLEPMRTASAAKKNQNHREVYFDPATARLPEPPAQQEAQLPTQTPQQQPAPIAANPISPQPSPSPAQPVQPKASSPPTASPPPLKKGFKLENKKLPVKAKQTDDIEAKSDPPKDAPPVVVKESVMQTEAIALEPAGASHVNLTPVNKVFSRELMLRIWQMHKGELHGAVAELSASVRPGDKTPALERKKSMKREEAPDRANVFGTEMKNKGRKETQVLKPSENAYKVKDKANDRMEELERHARSLLNKICPDNLAKIVDQLANIKLHNAEELKHVIQIIFKKALAEPHYCATYADMVYALKARYPEFPPESEGEKPATFTRVLLNNCQNEFENMPSTFEATDEERIKFPNAEDLQLELKRKKDMMLVNMKFIGHLFLRQLLAVKVIGQVVHDLIGIKDGNTVPEEHMIECVCQLLEAIGHTLDENTHGESLMNSFQARLKDLSKHLSSDGKQAFSKRIRFAIEDLLDLRKNKWQKKVFKEQAMKINEVKESAKDSGKTYGGKPGPEACFSTHIAGQKPSYIDAKQRKNDS